MVEAKEVNVESSLVKDTDTLCAEIFQQKEIHELLNAWRSIYGMLSTAKKLDGAIRKRLTKLMHECNWASYSDKELQICVSMLKYKVKYINEEQLGFLLKKEQLESITTYRDESKLMIIGKSNREELNKHVKAIVR